MVKTKYPTSVRLDRDVAERLQDLSSIEGVTKSSLMNEALRVVYLPNEDEQLESERVGGEKSV